ncbi:MAG: glycosyltransferase family 4 protein [Candidatus Omnitrophota bacterium]
MKILIVNKFLYNAGGDALSSLATGRLLSSKGHDVIYWGMKHPLNPEYPYQDYFVPYADLVNPGGIAGRIKIAFNILYSLDAKKKMDDLIKIVKPDIIHLNNFAHQISPSILHAIRKYNIPVVMTMHDYKMVCASYRLISGGKVCRLCKDGKFYNCFTQRCVKNSALKSLVNEAEMYLHHIILHIYDYIDVFIAPSRFLKSTVEDMGFKGKIVYLPNFVFMEDFHPDFTWKEESVVYFGRLSEEKGLLTLLRAMKDIKNITLKIIGEGPMRSSLEHEVKGLNLQNIRFLGYKMGKELKEEIRKSMFTILPSEWCENNPRSIMEGFALGKPVIGARIGGIAELVKEGFTGLAFEPGDTNDLVAKIRYLITNPGKIMEMGKNAVVFVREELNSEKHYEKLIELYNEAISKHETR